ncbi:hypothetical protein CAFE_33430 [Caprobacter fermentans]|uniref:CARDB domain-containing protein n=1 Tax=Caproicibacter fermentans TaxID=2576756 RepID=A0A6N8I3J4_9FIRM|nr:CARDB domain-containing protein [Caproicibacter fermentans]MVB12602.1 hypothetical protein [Caproicibacter fermentans]
MIKIRTKAISCFLGVLLAISVTGPAFAQSSTTPGTVKDSYESGDFTVNVPSIENSKISNSAPEKLSGAFTVSDVKVENTDRVPDELLENVKDSNKMGVQSALPDLQMTSIKSAMSQPFEDATPIKFYSKVANVGSASVNSMVFTFYVDDVYQTSMKASGSLNPGEQATASFYMDSKVGGSHTIKVVVNESRDVKESDYDNNTGVGTFQWKACIALKADSVSAGFSVTPTMEDKTITFEFSNRGTLDAENVPVELDVNGTTLYSRSFYIEAKTLKRGRLSIEFHKAGRYTFTLKVDPDKKTNDLDRSNNSTKCSVDALYDVETFAGKWKNPDGLDVQICSSGAKEIQNDNAGDNALLHVTTAIKKWNGHVSRASYGNVQVTNTNKIDNEIPVAIQATAFNYKGSSEVLAQTQLYKKDSSGRLTFINDVETDSSSYAFAIVFLNTESFNTEDSKDQLRTITHEFGHVFGLAHPTCGDTAIMRQTWDPLRAYTIQPHDVFSLKALYK